MTRRRFFRLLAYVLLAGNVAMILWIWFSTSWSLLGQGTPSALLSVARLLGLLAAGGALLQFMLMGRAAWIEQGFGLERIAKLHRLNGYFTIICILLHAGLVTLAYAGLTGLTPVAQEISFITQFEDVWKAMVAAGLFVAVVGTSVWIVRKHLPYERWYWVHLMVYAAILLAFGHQINVGGSFLAERSFTVYWWILYLFVGVNVLIGRFLMPAWHYFMYRFVIDEIVRETPDTVSMYIRGRNLARYRAQPGQFVIIWLPIKEFWWEEHPFSLSALPAGDRLRITPKNVGDYTAKLPNLKPGTPIVLAGPYGSFTPREPLKPKRLYIAGGVGITPLRAMLEAQDPATDSVLIYGNRTADNIIFKNEIIALQSQKKLTVHHVMSSEPAYPGETGYVDTARIQRLVPDCLEREVYLCGPPIMMDGIIKGLTAAGLPHGQLHYEKFALHPVS